ncbi:hypothetical protein [Pendulispora albinea]|uniref:Protein activator of alkane oxidation PraB n=1 Tax=Pendulispora albinea TaxID=2741071 RepID=A0ABZ2M3D1_9BACT
MIALAAGATLDTEDTDAAFRLTPVSTNFTATGSTTLKQGSMTLPCTAHFSGATDAAGGGAVTGANFSGGSICSSLGARGFPWTITADSLTQVTIRNVTVASLAGTCGPSTVTATYDSAAGTLTFNDAQLSGGCSVSGTLTTSPPITIASP